jgi:hypothetical protein
MRRLVFSKHFAAGAALVLCMVHGMAHAGARDAAGANDPVAGSPAVDGNDAIVRWARGTYDYGKLDSNLIRGQENWTLTVHPDGTRTVQAFVDLRDGDHQTNVILRVADDFRPLEGFASFWRSGDFGGSGWYRIDGERLHASVAGPRGDATHSMSVPEKVSLRVHPVITEGWQVWSYDRAKGGSQQGALYNVVTIGNPPVPGVGVLLEHRMEFLGVETVEVPAGSFTADHYTFYDGRYDIWLWGPDRILVRYANFGNGHEYRLRALETGP